MKRWIQCLGCGLLTLLLFALGGSFGVDAASDGIRVTSYVSGQLLYSGNDLQEAFDAAERGSVITIGRRYTLESDVVLDVEVMINGQNYLVFSNYRILLTDSGAIYVSEKFKRSTYVGALNPYSEVEWVEQGGGYVYYLTTRIPEIEDRELKVSVGGDVLGAWLDRENSVLYLDASVSGVTTENLNARLSMGESANMEVQFPVRFYFEGNVTGMASNGMTLIASAVNPDYNGKVEKQYTVVLLGDVNGNGIIDAADASLISFHANGSRELTGVALLAADVNRDGQVNAADAIAVCKKYVKPEQYASALG